MKKLMNKKAFTIMEMLIVVAIIAVLVAIAIPTFSSALTKAKEAADLANVRADYAEMQVDVLVNGNDYPASYDLANKQSSATITYTAPTKGKGDTQATKGSLTFKATSLTGGTDESDTEGHTWTWELSY